MSGDQPSGTHAGVRPAIEPCVQMNRDAPQDQTFSDESRSAEVRLELEAILSNPPLKNSRRLQRFLRYIVEETLEGRADRLIGYTIGLDVYDKGEDFDPALDSIVRVEASRLRQRLREHYAETDRKPRIQIALPKGTYVPEFQSVAAASAPSAWAKQAPADRGPSIAILPFENYGGDPSDQFFADGLTEEIIANLARFRGLFVFSRTTTSKLTRDGASIRQIHDDLGADFVLEGSVRKSVQSVRITTQLIDGASDGHLLAERFERPCTPEGVFEIQDEIALLVASRIAHRHGPLGQYAERAKRAGRSKRWETYVWITRFYDYYATHHPERHLEVREGLARALEHDPESSDGWAAFATVLLDEYRFHLNERPSFQALDGALEHALRAVTCDPENAFAYHALAMTYYHRGEVSEFHVAAERAIDLNPGHADMLADMGVCYSCLGEWDRGLALIDRAIELSPAHPGWYRVPRACHRFVNGDAEAAIGELKQVPAGGWFWYHALLACFYAELGNGEEAAQAIAELREIHPTFDARARQECQVWRLHDALTEKFISGWRKAGLDVA